MLRREHQRRRLAQLRAADDLSLERAGLEFEHGEPAQAAALARRWVDDAALGAHAAYLVGATQLRGGDAAGIEMLEACIARAPAWAAPARAEIEQALGARGRRGAALGRLHAMSSRAELRPAMLDDTTDALLREALSAVPTVAAASARRGAGLRARTAGPSRPSCCCCGCAPIACARPTSTRRT